MKFLASVFKRVALLVPALLLIVAPLFFSASPASADVSIKMGADSGMLAFEPSKVEIGAGESVTWVNNKLAPHNVVFENTPAGADAESLSHKALAFSPGESFSQTFDTPGEYTFYCEPHRGAGMVGSIVVK